MCEEKNGTTYVCDESHEPFTSAERGKIRQAIKKHEQWVEQKIAERESLARIEETSKRGLLLDDKAIAALIHVMQTMNEAIERGEVSFIQITGKGWEETYDALELLEETLQNSGLREL